MTVPVVSLVYFISTNPFLYDKDPICVYKKYECSLV